MGPLGEGGLAASRAGNLEVQTPPLWGSSVSPSMHLDGETEDLVRVLQLQRCLLFCECSLPWICHLAAFAQVPSARYAFP